MSRDEKPPGTPFSFEDLEKIVGSDAAAALVQEYKKRVDEAWAPESPSRPRSSSRRERGLGGYSTHHDIDDGTVTIDRNYAGVFRLRRRASQLRDIVAGVVTGGVIGGVLGAITRYCGGTMVFSVSEGHIGATILGCLHMDDDGEDGGGPELDYDEDEDDPFYDDETAVKDPGGERMPPPVPRGPEIPPAHAVWSPVRGES